MKTYKVIMGPNYCPGAAGFTGSLISNNPDLVTLNDLKRGDTVVISGMMDSFQNSSAPNIAAFMSDMVFVVERYNLQLRFTMADPWTMDANRP